MSTRSNVRPLPNDYNKINDLDISPKREKRRGKRINWTKIIAFICIVLLSVVIIGLYYLFQHRYKCVSNNVQICVEKGCVLSAASLLKSIQTKISPCHNLYQFSCDKSYEQQNQNNLINRLEYKSSLELKNLIESMKDEKQSKYMNKVYNYYKSCVNEELIEKLDLKPLNDILERLGGWPVVRGDKWEHKYKHFHWINLYIMMRKIGLNANSLINITVNKDIQNSSQYIVYIDQPLIDITPESLNNSEEYFDLMVKIAVMMGSDKIDAQNDLLKALIFEKQLIQLSLSQEDHRNNTYYNNNYMKVRQMQILAPNINWIQLLTEFIGQSIDENMEVIVPVPSYIRKLNQMIIQTESRDLANYLIWKVIYQNLELLNNKWRNPLEKYFLNTFKTHKRDNRWQTCLKQTKIYMPLELATIYMKRHFNKQNEIQIISMINNIKESFIEILDKNKWMSDEVKANTKQKILLMALNIGFPKELLEENQMDSRLKDVDIDDKKYFKNTIKLNSLKIDKQIKKLFKSGDKQIIDQQYVNPLDIVLKYRPEDNSLLISVALINGFYNENLPKYLNYGSLGLLISEQMVKVFDDIGRLYDGEGTHGNWWDKKSDNNFEYYRQCYEKQIKDSDDIFKQMSDKDRIESTKKLIIDNIVFRQTILSYRSFVKQFGPEFGLVGLDYTPEQLFWINSANTFCNIDYDNLWNSYERMKFRFNSVVSDVKEYSEAFNCSPKLAINRLIEC